MGVLRTGDTAGGGEAKPFERGLVDEWLLGWVGTPLTKLRGPVGGGAPILLVDVPGEVDVEGVDEDVDELAGKELRSARGPRGGALPDI